MKIFLNEKSKIYLKSDKPPLIANQENDFKTTNFHTCRIFVVNRSKATKNAKANVKNS